MSVFFNDDYVAAEHAFDTTRKAGWIADALRAGRLPKVELVDPAGHVPLAEQAIESIHTAEYVEALRTGEPGDLASSSWFPWDTGIWLAALNSTAGVLAAVEDALANGASSGSLSSGLHHARADQGSGFCTVNGLVAAARHALELIDGTVVILDVDAHCGGGTHSLIAGEARIRHLDLSVNSFDSYAPAGNNRLVLITDGFESDGRYLDELDGLLAEVPADTGLVFYNAGMDPHPTVSAEALAERESRVAAWRADIGIPLVFVLAGGYTSTLTEDELIDLHLHTLRAFAPKPKCRRVETAKAWMRRRRTGHRFRWRL